MKKYSPYEIKNIHTNDRFPGIVYAEIHDASGMLIISATLDYCVDSLNRFLIPEPEIGKN